MEVLVSKDPRTADFEELFFHATPSCRCECDTGGPCEHKWDGPEEEYENGSSVTCSKCGMSAISHSMRCF